MNAVTEENVMAAADNTIRVVKTIIKAQTALNSTSPEAVNEAIGALESVLAIAGEKSAECAVYLAALRSRLTQLQPPKPEQKEMEAKTTSQTRALAASQEERPQTNTLLGVGDEKLSARQRAHLAALQEAAQVGHQETRGLHR